VPVPGEGRCGMPGCTLNTTQCDGSGDSCPGGTTCLAAQDGAGGSNSACIPQLCR
jgi:hypothetical protein